MPITAIPEGVELRKITAVQKRALDELLAKQKRTSLGASALLVGVPTLVFGGVALAYVFKDELKENVEELSDYITSLPTKAYEGVIEEGFSIGKILTGIDLSEPTAATTGTIFENKSICERYGYDLVNLYARKPYWPWEKAAVGLAIREKLKGMKAAACTKPPYVEQKNWDRV